MSMRLIFWASRPDAAWLDPADTPVALGALTVRLSSEGVLAELLPVAERIDAVLAHRYDLTRREAAEMRRICEDVAARLPPGCDYQRLVAQHVPAEERAAFAHCLLHVAAAGRGPRAAASVARTFGLPDGALASADIA
ncbi:tellurite resistance TerB family protein [Roseivivax sediminis]|uniref:Tellurite resistance protein TerB n=1 Tax=Roseivivax sediminis TaxID=936889 RepID=A0A1I2BIL8_9RHOB|nr:hypothetical protein [Roseivivax sediminis]SFE55909.1 hypothetical protein SAMN04515678_11160 [Roseivivax sediminis]